MDKAVGFNVVEQHKIETEIDEIVESMEAMVQRLSEISNYERVSLILQHVACKNTANRVLAANAVRTRTRKSKKD